MPKKKLENFILKKNLDNQTDLLTIKNGNKHSPIEIYLGLKSVYLSDKILIFEKEEKTEDEIIVHYKEFLTNQEFIIHHPIIKDDKNKIDK